MRFQLAVIFTVLGLVTEHRLCSAQEEDAKECNHIKIHSGEHTFLPDDPICLSFDYCNGSNGLSSLRMNHRGLPGLDIIVRNEKGDPVEMWTWHIYNMRKGGTVFTPHGVIRPLHISDSYLMKSGESVNLCYDLNRLFQIKEPGTYHVTVRFPGIETAETTFEVARIDDMRRIPVMAMCNRIQPLKLPEGGSLKVSCDLELLTASTKIADKLCYARVRNIDTGLDLEPHQHMTLRVPIGTRIVQHELDVKMLLWTILEADGKQALVIWDLLRGTTRLAIPWGDQKIEMVTTRANRDRKGNIVLAGLPGKTRISSLSMASQVDDVNKAFVENEP